MTPLIAFMAPDRLWWLVLIPVILLGYLALLGLRANQNKSADRSRLARVLPKEAAWKRHLAVILATASLASLIIAFARPKGTVDVPRERATVVIAIDVSKSMVATDVQPNRIEAVQEAAKQFVGQLPPRYNVALVKFAGTASLVVQPTTDHGAVSAAIDRLQLAPSTAIGEGVYASLDSLALVPPDPDHPNDPVPAAIVLLSDGGTNIGRPSADAAKKAADMKCPVYTIAYGTANGYIESDGQKVPVPVNKPELQKIASLSGGKLFSAESKDQLKDVYTNISKSVGVMKVDQETTSQFVWYAVLCGVLASLGVISIAARWP